MGPVPTRPDLDQASLPLARSPQIWTIRVNTGWDHLPICMAKTHLSISHRAALKGRPSNYTFEVSDIRASVGAGFIYPIAGNIVTMPGLPGSPRQLDVDERGNILGL